MIARIRTIIADRFWARYPALALRAKPASRLGRSGFDPARELSLIGHAQRRAFIRSTARQMREQLGLPEDTRLAG